MTVKKLIKILSEYPPNAQVCVFLPTFKHPLEEANCLEVKTADCEFLQHVDGDGFSKWNRDGSPSGRTSIILRGDHEVNE